LHNLQPRSVNLLTQRVHLFEGQRTARDRADLDREPQLRQALRNQCAGARHGEFRIAADMA
jgi:hypothetical protein